MRAVSLAPALRAVCASSLLAVLLSLTLTWGLALTLSPAAGRAQSPDTATHHDSTSTPTKVPMATPQSTCISCGPTDNPPGVNITPVSSTFTSNSVRVTIDWCDDFNLNAGSRHITFNGVDVTAQFSYQAASPRTCGAEEVSIGTITLVAGANNIAAQIADAIGQVGSDGDTYTYNPPPATVSVTPDGQGVTGTSLTQATQGFTVHNTGVISATFNIALTTCPTGWNCQVSPTTISGLAANASATANVSYTPTTSGTSGTVTITATNVAATTISDPGSIAVTVPVTLALSAGQSDVSPLQFTPTSAGFTITNSGPVSTTFSLSSACGGAATVCSAPPSITVPASTSSTVTVSYTSGAAGQTGTVTLSASKPGDTGDAASATVTVHPQLPPPATVSVTPDAQPVTGTALTLATQSFTVQNTGSISATFSLATSCPSGWNCQGAPASVNLAAGASTPVNISYTPTTSGTSGTVALTATNTAATTIADQGSINVTVPVTLTLTADNASVSPPALVPDSATFTLANHAAAATTFTLTLACTGSGVTGCSGAPAQITVAAQSSSPIKVRFTTGTGSQSGTVRLTAAKPGDAGDVATSTVTVATQSPSVACSGGGGSVSPCTVFETVRVGATGQMGSYQDNNTSSVSTTVTFACSFTAPVTSCSMSPTHATVAGGSTGFSTLTYAVGSGEGTGTVTVTAAGINGNFSATRTVQVGKPPVVSPKAFAVNGAPSTSYTQTFTVQNPSIFSTTLAIAASCSSGISCTPVSTPINLGPGESATVPVSYRTPATGSGGTVALRSSWSTDAALADSGYANVTFNFLQVATTATNNDNQNLGLCAASCFTATYAQSTVPYISLNTPRSVTLAYHGDRMAVRPFIAADVSLHAGAPTLQQYWLQAQVNWGAGWTNITFLNGEQTLHFAPDPTHQVRLAGQFDASDRGSGVYPLRILVTAQYPTYTETWVDSSQVLIVDNARHSPYGRGWMLGGLQFMYAQHDSVLITEGDGSAVYFRCGVTTCTSPAGEFSALSTTGSGVTRTYRRAYPDSSIVMFNYLGQMTQRISLRASDTVSVYYDALGRVDSISDPVRREPGSSHHSVIRISYGASGLIQITEPGPDGSTGTGRTTSLTLGTDSTLQTIQDPDGKSTHFSYDANQRLSAITNRRGDVSSFVYRSDNSWKLAAQVAPNVPTDIGGGSTSLQQPTIHVTPWQIASVPTSPTASTPATPILTDSVYAVVTDPGGHATRFTVDRWGQPLTIIAPFGLTTRITRTGIFATNIVSPTGAISKATYNASGLLATSTPAGQGTTTITYGPYARPTQITGPGQPTKTFTYGKDGVDSLVTVAGSGPTRFYVDALGRDTMVVDPVGHTTKFHFEPTFGNLDSTLAEGSRWAKTIFDHLGRDSLHLANRLLADTTIYDIMNRPIRVASPGLGATTASYDAVYPTRLKDPKGNVYRVTVDALGRVSQRFDPADTVNRFLSYRYNLDGLLTSWTDRRGHRVDFAYDSLHREISKSGTGVVADNFSYKVDATGTIVVGWNGASRDEIYANPTGWTDSVVTVLRPASSDSVRLRRYYHHASGTTQLDSIGIATTSGIQFANRYFTWDASTARLDGVRTSAPQSNSANLTYTGEGLDSTVAWPGSLIQTFTHTPRHELLSTSFSVSVVNAALARQYGYADSLGHINQINRANGGDGEVRRFAYTPAGELSGAWVDSLTSTTSCPPPVGNELLNDGYGCTSFAGEAALHTLTFSYDSAGNRTTTQDAITGSTTLGSYTTGNRLTGWGSAIYTRDLDGNDSTKTVGGQTTTYSWTADGHLNSVTVGSTTLLYAYNAFGQLVQRSRSVNQGAPVLERQFLWDQGQLLAELDGSATHRIAEYAYWPGTDQPYALITGDTAITDTRYFEQDATGNVIGVFTPSGVAQSLVYQPFGELDSTHTVLGALADTNRLRWKGLMWEGDVTRLYYVRNRWYDPQAGRFLSEDPIGQSGGVNLYAFAGDDPINMSDPMGTDPSGICDDGFDLDITVANNGTIFINCFRHGAATLPPVIIHAHQSGATANFGNPNARGGGRFGSDATFVDAGAAAAETKANQGKHVQLGPCAAASGSFLVHATVDGAFWFSGYGEIVEGTEALGLAGKASLEALFTDPKLLGTNAYAKASAYLARVADNQAMFAANAFGTVGQDIAKDAPRAIEEQVASNSPLSSVWDVVKAMTPGAELPEEGANVVDACTPQ